MTCSLGIPGQSRRLRYKSLNLSFPPVRDHTTRTTVPGELLIISVLIIIAAYSDQSHLGDMAQEFEKRLHWLREIIRFIRNNHVLDSISLNARQRLAVDYKVVSSGAGLWTFLNVRGRLR